MSTSHRTQIDTDKSSSNVHPFRSVPHSEITQIHTDSELSYQFQSTCSSSPPALASKSVYREHSTFVNTVPCQPMALSITTSFLPVSLSSLISPLLFLFHRQLCPRSRQCPHISSAHSHAVLPQKIIPSSLIGGTRKEGSSATSDSPAQPAPGIAQSSHHLQTLGRKPYSISRGNVC